MQCCPWQLSGRRHAWAMELLLLIQARPQSLPRQPLGLQWPRTHTPFALRVVGCPLSGQHVASKVIDAALFTDTHRREQTRETRIANTVVSRKVGAHRSHATAFPTRSLCSGNRNVSAGIMHLTVVENTHVPSKSRKRDPWPGQVCRPFRAGSQVWKKEGSSLVMLPTRAARFTLFFGARKGRSWHRWKLKREEHRGAPPGGHPGRNSTPVFLLLSGRPADVWGHPVCSRRFGSKGVTLPQKSKCHQRSKPVREIPCPKLKSFYRFVL